MERMTMEIGVREGILCYFSPPCLRGETKREGKREDNDVGSWLTGGEKGDDENVGSCNIIPWALLKVSHVEPYHCDRRVASLRSETS